jgi:crotonobetainyl-CoA:carnitine CoA-transferase CaiB-like acyl-CoA transferase
MSWTGPRPWESLKKIMGNPDWAEEEPFSTPALRGRNWSAAFEHIEEWASDYTKDALFLLCQANRVPCAPVNEGTDLLVSDGLSSRAFWDDSEGGAKGAKLPGIRSQFIGTDW